MNKKASLSLALVGMVALVLLFQNFDFGTPVYTAPSPSVSPLPDVFQTPFTCSVANQYADCTKEVRCPAGYYPEKMRAICNLESGYVDRSVLATMGFGEVRVVQTSTVVSDGLCSVDQVSLNAGSKWLPSSRNPVYGDFRVHCHEKDDTSGNDCFVTGDMVCRRYDGPMFMHKIEFSDPTRGPQGFAKIGENFWLVSQDMGAKLRISLTSNTGKHLTEWTFPYASHGQGLYVRPTSTGAYDVFVENPTHDGFIQLLLKKELTELTYVREIFLTSDGQAFGFDVFGVDQANDRIVFLTRLEPTETTKGKKMIYVMKLSSALAGRAETTAAPFNLTGAYGSLQGISTIQNSIYVLFGDTALTSKKWIVRTSLDGKVIAPTEISVSRDQATAEGEKFEPEGLHVDSSYAYFSMVTSAWNRFFRIPLKSL